MVGGQGKSDPQRVQIVRDDRPLWWVAFLGLLRIVGGVLRFAARHTVVTAVVVVVVWARVTFGSAGAGVFGLVVAGVVIASAVVWWWRWPASFRARVWLALLARWRWLWVYGPGWARVTAGCGLTAVRGVDVCVPKVLRVTSSGWCDRLLVATLPGQHLDTWAKASPALAHAFGARGCRVRPVDPPASRRRRASRGLPRVWVEFTSHDDPLLATVRALPVPDPADLFAVPVGRCEDGSLWLLRLLGTHVLVVGVTGAGKGSVIWSLLRGIASAIHGGVVAVWAIDPKGGMELGFGRGMFTRFATDPADIVTLLEQAVAEMRARAARLAGVVRLHAPTTREPLVVVLVDEIASLTAYLADRDLKRRAEAALSLLLSQGRAVGVTVVGSVQDPRKEVLNLRNLFPTRVALRLDEPSQVDMVLGDGAYDRGAACDLIPEATPGIGYVRLDGQREPVRVRAAFVTDADIQEMAVTYRAGASSGLRAVHHDGEAA